MKYSERNMFGKQYKLIEKIDEGGLKQVYKVFDTARSETVILKELDQYSIKNESDLLKFKNDFRIISQFKHTNIARIYNYEINADKIPVITMEFVEGKKLSEFDKFQVEQVIDILIRLCEALSYIHSQLYVHCKLKLDNIKFSEDGSIKLLDHGILSQVGTPAPDNFEELALDLAPELITGGIIDESTDFYLVGTIGYQLLTGQRPFVGSKEEILQGHLSQHPIEPIAFRREIPELLNTIIMKLLAKDQSSRYRIGSALLEDLQQLTTRGKPVEVTRQKQAYLYSSKLIGRRKETDRFLSLIDQLGKGKSHTFFIGAPAGVGKTRLLSEFKTLTQLAGVQSFFLDCQNSTNRIYGVIDELLQNLLLFSNKFIIKKYAARLTHISPAILKYLPEKQDKGEKNVFPSLSGWLTQFTEKKSLVIFIDNLHLTDINSLQIINDLIRHKDDFKILLVSAFRSNEVDKTSPIWQTPEEGITDYIELEPLTQSQTRTLLEHLLYPTAVSQDFVVFCFSHSGGNPFDLLELLRWMIHSEYLTKSGWYWREPEGIEIILIPEKLENRILARMEHLEEDARKMAEVASVFERLLDLEIWWTVSGFKEDHFFHAVDELVTNQIVVKVDGNYMLIHSKLKEIIYNNLDNSLKREFHFRAAEYYEMKLEDEDQKLIPVIAKHYVAARQEIKAIEYSLQAGKIAEQNKAEWEAFCHYKAAAQFLEEDETIVDRDTLLLSIYEKAAQFSSPVWGDAPTCLAWLQNAIDFYSEKQDMEKIFNLSLSYVVTCVITSNYDSARQKISEIIQACQVKEGTHQWAVLFGVGVCLTDWYQGYQVDCFNHAQTAIDIFETQLDTLPDELWPPYSWALFWRDKARAYLGKPIDMANIEKIRQLMESGKSDLTIYWHTLTAVGARATFTGRFDDLMDWKTLASKLSQTMGRVYWFECWISHSYLYGALHQGEFSHIKQHIDRIQHSSDPYQVRLAYLFRGRWYLIRKEYQKAIENFQIFFDLEEKMPDNSYLEGFIYLAKTYLAMGNIDEAEISIQKGCKLAESKPYENPLYRLQFYQLRAKINLARLNYKRAEEELMNSLKLAEETDNPIQKGFIQQELGLLYKKQNKMEQAERLFSEARDNFLELDNTYQVGLLTNLT